MRIFGTVLLSLLVCLGIAGSVSAQNSPLQLSSISLSSASVTEGHSLQGTVTLNMAAPGDGVAVTLAADPVDAAIFSPPYPNSFDYTDVYNLELWVLGYLDDASEPCASPLHPALSCPSRFREPNSDTLRATCEHH